ncbi:hypothetical protein [Lactiplantibacillus plantarum]|uniref:hypothetical protein n=1 Tax=Lactiplantibacillus plantarum TaxID=1590 RepID=UPI001BA44A5C|nr:hypothetical protein [Lactiplantibacillus plantarum]MBS0955635.1 hypothetical protein [Lactiplantibacillus plantarum]
MNRQDLIEFWYYLRLMLDEWLKVTQSNPRYQALLARLSYFGRIIGQLYFENTYLNTKRKLLKKVNRKTGQYDGHPRIKKNVLVVVILLLTWWTKWMLLVDLVMVGVYLYYVHYQYIKDQVTVAVGLVINQLPRPTLNQEYYQYPINLLRNLIKLYELLRVSNQRISFEDFIAAGTLQLSAEKGFSGLITFAVTSCCPNIKAIDFNDLMLNYYLIPDAKTGYYILNGWLKLDLIGLITHSSMTKLLNTMAKNRIYSKNYPEVKQAIISIKKNDLNRKHNQYVANHDLPDKIWSIWKLFDLKSKKLGFSYWNNNSESITGNACYIKVRMRLIGDNTYLDAKKKTDLVAKELRCDVMTAPIASDHGSFWMTFILNGIKSPRTTNVATIKKNAEKGYLNLGNSRTGQYLVKLPRADELTSILNGAISRAGKSTLTTQIILSLLYLKTNEKYDYSDVYIGTVKDEDYRSNGFKNIGMLVESEPLKIYKMLQYVDIKATERKQLFIDRGVKNIKEFNQKYHNEYLGKQLIIFDEYANTLAAAESEQIEMGGKKVKLRLAIEQLMVKIAQEHGSRGVSLIVITQQFSKGEVGRLFDATNIQILGYAKPNVWNSIDNTQEMSKYLQAKSDQRRGLFFINAPDLPVKGPQIVFNNGFTEVKTANIETAEVRKHFDRHFNTSSDYYRENDLRPDTPVVKVKPIHLEKLIN